MLQSLTLVTVRSEMMALSIAMIMDSSPIYLYFSYIFVNLERASLNWNQCVFNTTASELHVVT